jgi:CrcB protein
MIRTILYIGAGSFAGGIMRFLLSKFIQNSSSGAFPIGTMAVNVLGCLIIGILYGLFEKGDLMNGQLRLFLTVGFCGGFTSFSTFIHENYSLLNNGDFLHFALYASLSFILGLFAAYLGHLLIKLI